MTTSSAPHQSSFSFNLEITTHDVAAKPPPATPQAHAHAPAQAPADDAAADAPHTNTNWPALAVYTADQLRAIVLQYQPLARSMASAAFDKIVAPTRRSAVRTSDTMIRLEDLVAAALEGLVEAERRWDPLMSSCEAKCRLSAVEATCEHGRSGYTLGAYARRWIFGAIFQAVKSVRPRRATAHAAHLAIPEELMRSHGDTTDGVSSRVADRAILQDGSDYDGQPAPDRWPKADMERFAALIQAAVESGRVMVPGMSKAEIRTAIGLLSSGRSDREVASAMRVKGAPDAIPARSVTALRAALRNVLTGTDFAAQESGLDRSYSLADCVAAVIERDPTADRERVRARVDFWLSREAVRGATRDTDGHWVVSQRLVKAVVVRWMLKEAGKQKQDLDDSSTARPC